jgi:hypothetical protein
MQCWLKIKDIVIFVCNMRCYRSNELYFDQLKSRKIRSAVGRGRAGRPEHDQQHCYHHAPKVKPEAATAVVELLMMGVRTPKTC